MKVPNLILLLDIELFFDVLSFVPKVKLLLIVITCCSLDRAVADAAHELRQLVDTTNAPVFGIDVDGNFNE